MSKKVVKHAIQLKGIMIKELFIRVNSNNSTFKDDTKHDFQMSIGHSDYNKKLSEIDVGVVIKIGSPDLPEKDNITNKFDLKVHLLAKFSVDASRFPINKLEHWAENNAPLILYPYIREHVHALTIRANITPVLLPLMEVPTLKIE